MLADPRPLSVWQEDLETSLHSPAFMPRRHAAPSRQEAHDGGVQGRALAPGAPERAQHVLRSLGEVVHEAQARGLPLAAAFAHFARQGETLAGADELLQAVTELRLGVPGHGALWDERDAEDKRALKQLETRSRRHRQQQDAKPPLTLSSTPTFSSDGSPFDSSLDSHRSKNEAEPEDTALDEDHEDNNVVHDSTRVPALPLNPPSPDCKDEPLVFHVAERWQHFQVDGDTSIAYGILTHDVAAVSPRADRTPGEAAAAEEAEHSATLTSFRLTVFLDAFQRLETLEDFFRPLLVHFPRGKILLCGFPTRTKRSATWSSTRFAAAYARLLTHLAARSREWLVQPKLGIGAVPQYLVGFGTGASVALQLLGMELPQRGASTKGAHGALTGFARALRGLVLVNALARITDAERHTLRSLQRLLEPTSSSTTAAPMRTGDVMELHEALADALFSDHYLTQGAAGRRTALEGFFHTRQGFLQRSPLVGGTAGGDCELLRVLLRGAAKSRDVSAAVANLAAVVAAPFALVLVHGSQNALFSPQQVEQLTTASSFEPAASLSDALALAPLDEDENDVLERARLHVAWLKGGHELLQERASFFYDLFRQLIAVDVTRPSPPEQQLVDESSVTAHKPTSHDDSSINSSPPTSSSLHRSASRAFLGDPPPPSSSTGSRPLTQPTADPEKRVAELLAAHGLPWIQQELYDRGLEGSGPTETILKRYERALASEDRSTRRERRRTQRTLDKHEAVEAARRAREKEALERELRAVEARRAIQQREREAQQAFFAQMEAQKHSQAQRLQEQEHMTLEDFHSRKQEELRASAQQRRTRNDAVARQVAELEAERQEQARREQQVAQQQRRLQEQHEQREELKRCQRAFEQNELVASPVEAYWLDAAPVYERFDDLSAGARTLAADLTHFYRLKTLQRSESTTRRQELETLQQGELAQQELATRNLERVLAKARSTGMIAKAGLGTVRVVPVSASELQALARQADEAHDVLARLQNDVAQRRQELAWKDSLLQRLSVLVQRNERFRVELRAKLEICAELGNERVLSLREERETLETQREARDTQREKLERRRQAVMDEAARARAAETAFFDTRLRVEGAMQRVQRVVIIKELETEAETLGVRLQTLDEQEATACLVLRRCESTLAEVADRTFTLEESLRALDLAVESSELEPSGGEDASEGQTQTQTHDGQQTTGEALAELVRHKKHADRTEDEKRWVGLDFLVNFARYYQIAASEELDFVQQHADYQQTATPPLSREQLQRLLKLPARNCLAVAFLKSREELEAHELLRKFSFGDGEGHFARLDQAFQLPADVAAPRAEVVSNLADALAALERLADVTETPTTSRARCVLLDEQSDPVMLLHAPQCQLLPHKSVTHSFRLPSHDDGVGVLALTVSVVFQGHFRSVGYQNGRLAAMLYVLPPASDVSTPSRAATPLPIGKCFHAVDLELCSPQRMGRVVLRHEPLAVPLSADASYQLVLGAPVFTAYSVDIRARTALFADEALRRQRVAALKQQELLPRRQDELQNIFVTIQLSERKKRLARRLATEAQDHARVAELELLRGTKQLEQDDAEPALDPHERRELHASVRTAREAFTQSCFLFSAREQEVRDLEQSLRELTRIHVDVLNECERMERALADCRTHLPAMAAVLHESEDAGDVAGAKLARELGVEYVCRAGVKSSAVRWAELSAMKAKLPSMMTPAERLRRKYKKAREPLEKAEREWVLLDRVLHPRLYRWDSDGHTHAHASVGDMAVGVRLRLHGAFPALSKDEQQLAALSKMELERVAKAPWNLLERKEIRLRKILTRFRDEGASGRDKRSNSRPAGTTVVALLRSQKPTELTREEREWRLYDQLLHPAYYPTSLSRLAHELAAGGHDADEPKLPPGVTRADVVAALETPEEELFKLPSELLRARGLLLQFDPQLGSNLAEAARQQHASQAAALHESAELDVDARCRLVFQELQRAIANTRNEFMDSAALHSTLQRFPTKVLRLELEKELDRLLVSQIQEKEAFDVAHALASGARGSPETAADSDSDDEARLAREAEAQRQSHTQAKRGAKARGRALQYKSLQRQRREIKDALQGRSLEQRRLLQRAQELGPDGCMGCQAAPCRWQPFLEAAHAAIQERVEAVQDELERVKRCREPTLASAVCLAAVRSGGAAVTLRRGDLLDELTRELTRWGRNLRLRAVDAELHETFRSPHEFFETQALHGFRQIQHRPKVQLALRREHDRLVALLTAHEVLEDVLEAMLEGWVFGERESERPVLGFVPSLKRDGPLSMQDLRRLEQDRRLALARRDVLVDQQLETQGLQSDKWQPIEVAACQVDRETKAVREGSRAAAALSETEQALRFGLFSMTLMYFRGLALLRQQQAVWSVSAAKQRHANASQAARSAERVRMDQEQRHVQLRAAKAALYDAKARHAQARKHRLHEHRTAAYRRRLVLENRQATRERRAATAIQRTYRGRLGRLAGRRWMLRRRELEAQRALAHAAAVTLQRAYRGRLGRLEAEAQRVELAEFISQVRAEEAMDEEDEYWRSHAVERLARHVAAFVRREA